MAYTTTRKTYGDRTETVTDVQAFARDLSKALGGGPLVPNRETYDNANFASFMLGADLVSVSGNSYGLKGRVVLRISAPDVKHDDQNFYDKTHKTPEATVDPNARTIERIAADIKRRVIDASQDALARQREYAKQRQVARGGLVEHVAVLRAAGLHVRQQGERELTASVSSGSGGHYFYGTVNSDGTVSFSSFGSLPIEKLLRVLAVIGNKRDA